MPKWLESFSDLSVADFRWIFKHEDCLVMNHLISVDIVDRYRPQDKEASVFLRRALGLWCERNAVRKCVDRLERLVASTDCLHHAILLLPPFHPIIVLRDIVARELDVMWVEELKEE